MRWLNIIGLTIIGVWLCLGNLWCSAVRSAIPLSMNAQVTKIDVRQEKHRGKDDVYLVHLTSGVISHVDAGLAKQLEIGDHLKKRPWEDKVQIQSANRIVVLQLDWSEDLYGMLFAMPLVLLILVTTSIVVVRSKPYP